MVSQSAFCCESVRILSVGIIVVRFKVRMVDTCGGQLVGGHIQLRVVAVCFAAARISWRAGIMLVHRLVLFCVF